MAVPPRDAVEASETSNSTNSEPHCAWLAAWQALDARLIVNPDDRQAEAEWHRLIELIVRTPAKTKAGAAAQLRFLIAYVGEAGSAMNVPGDVVVGVARSALTLWGNR